MRVAPDPLRTFCSALLQQHGVPPDAAHTVADALVLADMRGVGSHGVHRLSIYLERLRRGAVAATPRITVIRETPATALLDAGNGLGMVAATEAMRRAVAKARHVGAAWVAVRNSNHFCMAAYYTLIAARAGMIGLAMTNAVSTMAPFGSIETYAGTNPIAVAVPAGREPPMVLDMATSAAARVYGPPFGDAAAVTGRQGDLPAGGRPVTDAAEAMRGILVPFAGAKGSGLALVIEALAGVLSGAMVAREVGHLYGDFDRTQGVGHLLGAIAVEAFADAAAFAGRMERLVRELRALRPAPGVGQVLAPGDVEWQAMQTAERQGVPVAPEVWEELAGLARAHGVPLPEGRAEPT